MIIDLNAGAALEQPIVLSPPKNEHLIIHGGPTTGKTTWIKALRAELFTVPGWKDVEVVDSDDIIKEEWPEWFDKQLWRTASKPLHARLNAITDAYLSRIEPALVLTNLWHAHLPLIASAFRGPKDMVQLDVERRQGKSGGFELAQVTGWYTSWMDFMQLAKHKLLLLGDHLAACFSFAEREN